MRIEVGGRGVSLTRAQQERVQRRLGLALGRYGDLVDRVRVRFTRDGTCAIEARLRARSVSAEDTDPDLMSALDRASSRLSRSLARALQREQDWTEGRATAPSKR